MQCIKLLSESDVSVKVRVFYDDTFGGMLTETFGESDIVDETGTTMCKLLKEDFFDKEVVKVDIQRNDVNDAAWQSQGILVQRIPGGKSNFYFNQINIKKYRLIDPKSCQPFILSFPNLRCLRTIFFETSDSEFYDWWMRKYNSNI